MTYCTLAQIQAELRADQTATAETAYLMNRARYVTSRIRDLAGVDFEPLYRTMTMTAYPTLVGLAGLTLRLPYPLLEPVSIVSDGSALVYLTDVFPEPEDARTPIRTLRMNDNDARSWYPSGSAYRTVAVMGWWGMRREYAAQGWVSSGDAVQGGALTDTAVSITVTDADGVDQYGGTPRFSAGNLIRIDSEALEITATNTATNVLTVLRGQRGTAAASHIAGAPIRVWNVEPGIAWEAARWACMGYARRGAFEEVTITEAGVATFPADAPRSMRAAIQEFANGY